MVDTCHILYGWKHAGTTSLNGTPMSWPTEASENCLPMGIVQKASVINVSSLQEAECWILPLPQWPALTLKQLPSPGPLIPKEQHLKLQGMALPPMTTQASIQQTLSEHLIEDRRLIAKVIRV